MLALSESLPFIGGHSRPFVPFRYYCGYCRNTFSRMNPRILPSHLHFAHTMQMSAIGELVIHVFEPDKE